MLIDEIIPYARNARHNERAVPVVADSIREFGLRGQIVLESRENPVIVTGHTRVAACRSLGWTEIPDENIAYCDGLTDEQIRAFRIADNKTGEVATWNRTLLQHEVKGIKKLDMSRFGCEFKAKKLAYGAERLRTDRAYNLDLVNRCDCGGGGFPALDGADAAPRASVRRRCGVRLRRRRSCLLQELGDREDGKWAVGGLLAFRIMARIVFLAGLEQESMKR